MSQTIFKEETVLHFYPCRVWKSDDSLYVFNIKTASIFRIDQPTWELLNMKDQTYGEIYIKFQDVWTKDEYKQLIEDLNDHYFIKNQENDIGLSRFSERAEVVSNASISNIVLYVTQECNLRCKYCHGHHEYEEKGSLSLENAKKAVDFLINNSDGKRQVSIHFFGGEPLLNFSVIKGTVDYCKFIEQKGKKEFHFSITTNATLLTEEITDYLAEQKFAVTVGIDGVQVANDYNRCTPDKKGTYKKVVENTRELVEKFPVSARVTVTNSNMDLIEDFEAVSELGFDKVKITRCADMKLLRKADYEVLSNELMDYVIECQMAIQDKDYKKAFRMNNVMKMLQRIHNGGVQNRFCGAIRHGVAVDIFGKCYPCHRFVGSDTYCIGDIFDGIDFDRYDDILRTTDVTEHDDCNECWAVNLCGGGCPHENYEVTGKMNKPNPNYCKMNKKFLEALIQCYIGLSKEQRTLLFEKSTE